MAERDIEAEADPPYPGHSNKLQSHSTRSAPVARKQVKNRVHLKLGGQPKRRRRHEKTTTSKLTRKKLMEEPEKKPPVVDKAKSLQQGLSGILKEMGRDSRSMLLHRLRKLYKKSVCTARARKKFVWINLAELGRVVLEIRQLELSSEALDFNYTLNPDSLDKFVSTTSKSLSDYISAWKDLEFMTEARKRKGYDPFIISTDYTMQRALLQDCAKALGKRTKTPIEGLQRLNDEHGLDEVFDKNEVRRIGGGTRSSIIQKVRIDEFLWKTVMAVAGGAFLIGPMLAMVLHPGRNISLVTTSVCVFVFGLLMSFLLEKPFDVLSATAAYAAVLVVFIGTSQGQAS